MEGEPFSLKFFCASFHLPVFVFILQSTQLSCYRKESPQHDVASTVFHSGWGTFSGTLRCFDWCFPHVSFSSTCLPCPRLNPGLLMSKATSWCDTTTWQHGNTSTRQHVSTSWTIRKVCLRVVAEDLTERQTLKLNLITHHLSFCSDFSLYQTFMWLKGYKKGRKGSRLPQLAGKSCRQVKTEAPPLPWDQQLQHKTTGKPWPAQSFCVQREGPSFPGRLNL